MKNVNKIDQPTCSLPKFLTNKLEIRSDLNPEQLQKFASAIKRGSNLQQLSLRNLSSAENLLVLLKAANENKILQSLHLNNNTIDDSIMPIIIEIMQGGLTELKLNENEFGSDLISLLQAMANNTTITNLDLSNNRMDKLLTNQLATLLLTNHTITTLVLANNDLNDEALKPLWQVLPTNESLSYLDLSQNPLNDQALASLGVILVTNKGLKTLKLGGLKVTDQGIKELTQGIKANNSLTSLHLSSSNIYYYGALAIADLLTKNNNLIEFSLLNNYIAAESIAEIADALNTNTKLKTLSILHENTTPGAATAIATMISSNKTLEQLNLRGNTIGDAEALLFAEALLSNQNLISLDLSHNKISLIGAQALLKAIKKHHRLAAFDIDANDFEKEAWKCLYPLLSANYSLLCLGKQKNQNLDNLLKRNNQFNQLKTLIHDLNHQENQPINLEMLLQHVKSMKKYQVDFRLLFDKLCTEYPLALQILSWHIKEKELSLKEKFINLFKLIKLEDYNLFLSNDPAKKPMADEMLFLQQDRHHSCWLTHKTDTLQSKELTHFNLYQLLDCDAEASIAYFSMNYQWLIKNVCHLFNFKRLYSLQTNTMGDSFNLAADFLNKHPLFTKAEQNLVLKQQIAIAWLRPSSIPAENYAIYYPYLRQHFNQPQAIKSLLIELAETIDAYENQKVTKKRFSLFSDKPRGKAMKCEYSQTPFAELTNQLNFTI